MERRRVLGSLAIVGAAALPAAAAVAAASPAAPAPDAAGAHDMPTLLVPGVLPPPVLARLADRLGLTPGQRQAIRGYVTDAVPGLVQLRRQMRANLELLAKTRPDDPAFTSVVADVSRSDGELTAEFVLKSSQLRSQVFGSLTEEQRVRLADAEASLDASLAERRERRELDTVRGPR